MEAALNVTGDNIDPRVPQRRTIDRLRMGAAAEVLADDAVTQFHPYALLAQGKATEAVRQAEANAAARPEFSRAQEIYLQALYETRSWSEIAEFFDEKFGDLESYRRFFLDPNYVHLIAAFSALEHPMADETIAFAADAYEQAKISRNHLQEKMVEWAEFLTLTGDEDGAFSVIEAAIDEHGGSAAYGRNPVFHQLSDEKRFKSVLDSIETHMNGERAKLGLDPFEIQRAPLDPTGGS